MPIILDSNIFISALIKNCLTRAIILFSGQRFLLPEYSIIEIKNHEAEIFRKSKLSKKNYYVLMKKLMKYVEIVQIKDILKYKKKAQKIMEKIDEEDVLFVACALAYPQSIIWSNDKHFKLQKAIKTYNTFELLKRISKIQDNRKD